MGSITSYTVQNPNNTIVTIRWRCSGDRGEVEEGIELEFPFLPALAKRYDLTNGSRIPLMKLQSLQRDVELLREVEKSK